MLLTFVPSLLRGIPPLVAMFVLVLATFALLHILRTLIFWAGRSHSMGPAAHSPFEIGASKRYFKSARTGLWVYHQTWLASSKSKGERCHIVLLHGMGEHLGRFQHVAELLSSHGFTVHAMDHQGHGASEGDRCWFAAFSHLRDDVIQFILDVKRLQHVSTPVFLMGHSLGGLIALHVAEDSRVSRLFAGVAITGPALSFGADVDNPINRGLAKLFSAALPKVRPPTS